MSEETLELAISRVLNSNFVHKKIEFLWHAGEPLTVGIKFYQIALNAIAKHNRRHLQIRNTIQTNGTLINDPWCKFFKENEFQVGVSIDGPDFVHDRNRVLWSGKGTHKDVMRGINVLQRNGIYPGIICVLTRHSLDYPEEIFNFFLDNNLHSVGFNVEEIENCNLRSSLEFNKDDRAIASKYRDFMSALYDLWKPHHRYFRLREFDDMLAIIYQKQSDPQFCRRPDDTIDLRIVTISKDGYISTYSPEFAGMVCEEYNNFIVGHISDESCLDNVLINPTFLKLREDIEAGIKMCRASCNSFDLCGGGSPSNKITENGTLKSTENLPCILHRKVLASVVIDKLIRESQPLANSIESQVG